MFFTYTNDHILPMMFFVICGMVSCNYDTCNIIIGFFVFVILIPFKNWLGHIRLNQIRAPQTLNFD